MVTTVTNTKWNRIGSNCVGSTMTDPSTRPPLRRTHQQSAPPRSDQRRRSAFVALAATGALLLAACGSETQTTETTTDTTSNTTVAPTSIGDGHNAQNSLDWAGGYFGRLPCADCEGIDTVLTILSDGTYTLTRTYVGIQTDNSSTPAAPESVTGTFRWVDGTVIELEGLGTPNEPNRYRVEENQLRQLDIAGSVIEGALADSYVLKRMPEDFVPPSMAVTLEGTTWQLVQLSGTALADANATAATHYLTLANGKASAKAGCNQIGGSYSTDDGGLRFDKLVSTKMACENMADETALTNALGATTAYALETGNLVLLNGTTEVARFTAAR